MKVNPTVKYRVAPIRALSGHFPIDMLRYDMAYPANESESTKIVDTFWYTRETGGDSGTPPQVPIDLVATASGCPNAARWHSFGWHVTHVWNGTDWEMYHAGYRHHRVIK